MKIKANHFCEKSYLMKQDFPEMMSSFLVHHFWGCAGDKAEEAIFKESVLSSLSLDAWEMGWVWPPAKCNTQNALKKPSYKPTSKCFAVFKYRISGCDSTLAW